MFFSIPFKTKKLLILCLFYLKLKKLPCCYHYTFIQISQGLSKPAALKHPVFRGCPTDIEMLLDLISTNVHGLHFHSKYNGLAKVKLL